MAERLSALADNYPVGRFGADGAEGVQLQEVPDLVLTQVGAWPDTLAEVGARLASHVGAEAAPKPCRSVSGPNGVLLRVEPLKWWILDGDAPQMTTQQGATLDLSHSRTRVRVSGPDAAALINRHLPLDLRASSFPVGAIGSTAFHYVGVTLWRSEEGYELFFPRGYALTLWEMLLESAGQFGARVI